jgi:hypothetical protein
MIGDGGEILEAAGGFVVDDGDVIAAREEGFGEVGADEAGTAGDEGIGHKIFRFGTNGDGSAVVG